MWFIDSSQQEPFWKDNGTWNKIFVKRVVNNFENEKK